LYFGELVHFLRFHLTYKPPVSSSSIEVINQRVAISSDTINLSIQVSPLYYLSSSPHETTEWISGSAICKLHVITSSTLSTPKTHVRNRQQQGLWRLHQEIRIEGIMSVHSLAVSLSHHLPAQSQSLGGLSTNVNVFIPEGSGPFPVLYYLSGLTCNEDNGCA